MKILLSRAVTVLALITWAASESFAQTSASSSSAATIVTPISIVKNVDMNFGNVAIASTSGTVVLTPAGTRTATSGVTLPAAAGPVTVAAFTITGQGAYTYSITLPTSPLTLTNGTNSMVVNSFTSTPSATGALSSGTQTVTVGATLNLTGSQATGTYTSVTPFNVTVNYN